MESDSILITCVFEIFMKKSIIDFEIFRLDCASLPVSTMQCRLEYTGMNLETSQDKELIFILESKIRGRLSSVMGSRYVQSDQNLKDIQY